MTLDLAPFFLMDTIPLPPTDVDRPTTIIARRFFTRGWPEAAPDPLPYWWVD